jgi:hypothetical protein
VSGVEVAEYHGVPIAFATVEEAVAGEWKAVGDQVDVVRVERPPAADWPELRRAGFVPKPQFVTWIAEARASEEEYLGALPKRERQKIRGARRQLRLESLTVEVCAVEERLFDVFLVLYEQQIAEMRHGVAVAREERELVLADAASYFAICARRDAALVGCCIAQRDEAKDTVRVRFSAVDGRFRESNLARVLYMEAAERTRTLGHRWFSLGKDRNLYGHLATPGLYRFKSHLGLVPHASHLVDPAIGYDQADLILRLGELGDPTLVLGYVDDAPSHRLRLDVFSAQPEARLDPYRAPFLCGSSLHVLEQQAQLV